MPCASVSENPTRVSAEYLNGGLRSVTRPSSSVIRPDAKRRQPAAPRAVPHGPGDAPARKAESGGCEQAERQQEVGAADAAFSGRARRAPGSLRTEIWQRAHLR